MKRFKRYFAILKDTYFKYMEDDTWTMGAALSYYTIFSLAPTLLIVISIAGLIFGRDAVEGRIFDQISGLIGKDGAGQVQDLIARAYSPKQSRIATIIATVLLLFGATTLFAQLQASINKIWGVKPMPKRSYVKYVLDRLRGFSLIISIGFVLLVSLVLSAGLTAMTDKLTTMVPDSMFWLFRGVGLVIGFLAVTTLFAILYKFLPDAKVTWRDVWVGSLFTSGLFTLGRFLIGLYIGQSNVGSTYGAAGSLIVVLLWVNYSSQLLFFGASFTEVYARTFGSLIKPSEFAVRIKTVHIEQEPFESNHHFLEKVESIKGGDYDTGKKKTELDKLDEKT